MTEIWEGLKRELTSVAPTVGWVILTLLVGLFLSWLVARAVRWGMRRSGLEALGERAGVAKLLYGVGIKRGLADLVGRIVFWAGVLVMCSAIAEILSLPGVAALSTAVMAYLPRLLAALAVSLVGMWLAGVAEALVSKSNRLASPTVVGRVIYYVVLLVGFTLGARQAGVETDLIHILIGVAAASAGLAIAGAFAVGSRDVFASLVSRHYAQVSVRPGDRVRVGDLEGEVESFTALAAVISLADGSRVFVPCRRLITEAVTVLPPIRDPM